MGLPRRLNLSRYTFSLKNVEIVRFSASKLVIEVRRGKKREQSNPFFRLFLILCTCTIDDPLYSDLESVMAWRNESSYILSWSLYSYMPTWIRDSYIAILGAPAVRI